MSASVEVEGFDTTLRDGAQALPEAHQFKPGSKPEIAHHLAQLGMDVIEAGFPATPGDDIAVQEVAQSVGQTEYAVARWKNGQPNGQQSRSPVIAGLSRTVSSDIETTWDAIHEAKRARIHTFVSTDAEHLKAKFPGKTPEQVLAMGSEAIRFAKKLTQEHQDATIEFSAEAASTTDATYLEAVIKEAVNQGADVINVPDTVGQRDPFWMHEFYGRVIDWVMRTNPNVTISAHNHNDLGMAAANSHALVRAAADYAHRHQQNVKIQLETTICGLGERAGNADVFPVFAGLFKFAPELAVPVDWRFNPQNSVLVAQAVMRHAGLEVDRQSPVVGSDINTHRAGIHADGVIKGGAAIYTPTIPIFWGHAQDAVFEDGLYQGKAGRQAAVRGRA